MDGCCEPDPKDATKAESYADLLYFVKKIEKHHLEPAIVLSNAGRLRLLIEAMQVYEKNRAVVDKHLSQAPARKPSFFERIFGKS